MVIWLDVSMWNPSAGTILFHVTDNEEDLSSSAFRVPGFRPYSSRARLILKGQCMRFGQGGVQTCTAYILYGSYVFVCFFRAPKRSNHCHKTE